MKVHEHIYERIISPENLFLAWEEFRKGKRSRTDVMLFEEQLEPHLFALHRELHAGEYRHGPYSAFMINDPKQRQIHKATVRDRILHHAVFSVLNPIFEPTFIAHSFSCRKGKGTHRGVAALQRMLLQVSRNRTRSCFALKCDIHRFFASVDHGILLGIMGKRIKDEQAMRLLENIVHSFDCGGSTLFERKGIPIGNLTSQLFANVYLNELDQFIKHALKMKHFVRYTDDFVIVSSDEHCLRELLPPIRQFLCDRLCLALHPTKVMVRKYRQGIDFLGYVLLRHHRMQRKRTERRMFRNIHKRVIAQKAGLITEEAAQHSLQSYLGVLSHADTYQLRQTLRNQYWFWLCE